jgi:antagonist of KipI
MSDPAITESASRKIRVIQPGPMTLIQDRGRTGFQQLGVSVSGAVDVDSLDLGNRLVGNNLDSAALEIMLGGLEIEFSHDAIFAITGAELVATLEGVPVSPGVSYTAHAGSHLAFGMVSNGLRAYVAIAGGVDVPELLGSRSTHLASEIGGINGRSLVEGDVLTIGDILGAPVTGRVSETDESAAPSAELNIRVVLGPQDDEFSQSGIDTFLSSTFTVTDQSNRQGLRLDGPQIESKSGRYDIVSDAVVNGSIQIPGDGKPIILLADRQTTGGYAKIATVASVDLPKLGQASPGTAIIFTAISVADAQQLLVDRFERVNAIDLEKSVDSISVQVDGEEISVGVAENANSQIAEINGNIYPISVDEYTPAD